MTGLPSYATRSYAQLVFTPPASLDGTSAVFTVTVSDKGEPPLSLSKEIRIEFTEQPGGSGRYLVTGTGEQIVEDMTTGLFWTQDFVEGTSWQGAIDYCNSASYAGQDDWRLPDEDELSALLSAAKTGCANSDFPGMPCIWFWSSSSYASNAGNAWYVNFGGGSVGYGVKYYDYAARCVRP